MSIITWAFRTMIVPAEEVELARALAAAITGDAGSGMWATALSVSGEMPASHYISSGMIDAEFAALLPLTTVGEVIDDVATPDVTAPGEPGVLAGLASQAGLTVTVDQVAAVLDAANVMDLEPFAALEIAGLRIAQEVPYPV